jgi:hypothetical protein
VAREAPRHAACTVTADGALLLMLLLAAPAGQGLGDAAKKAQEGRSAGAAGKTLTERDLSGAREWEMTVAGVELYSAVRTELAAIRKSRPAVHTRLYDASRSVSRLSELEPALAREPLVVAVLEKYALTPGDYLRMDQAMLTANYWWTQEVPEGFRRQLVHYGNIRFMREHARLIRDFTRFGDVQWYDVERFIERF